MKPMETAPKDRNILLRVVTFAWDSNICQHRATGHKWIEGRWAKGLMDTAEKWQAWQGRPNTFSTEHIVPEGWAELP